MIPSPAYLQLLGDFSRTLQNDVCDITHKVPPEPGPAFSPSFFLPLFLPPYLSHTCLFHFQLFCAPYFCHPVSSPAPFSCHASSSSFTSLLRETFPGPKSGMLSLGYTTSLHSLGPIIADHQEALHVRTVTRSIGPLL